MVKRETDVLVIGGGPVGLFAALSLVERGLDVQILDKDWRGAAHSYALALHPRSLRLLDEYGLAEPLLEAGHKVERVGFYKGAERVGELDVTTLAGRFPFVLVVPQNVLEHTIEERLQQRKVKVAWNHQAMSLEQDGQGVVAKIGRMEKYSTGYPIAHTEWLMAKEYETRASYLIGADGYHSFVRKSLGADYEHVGPAEHFSVFECHLPIDFADEVRVILDDSGTNVVWPLDERRGRFSFQTDAKLPAEPTIEAVQELIRTRAPWFAPALEEIGWHTNVLFERRLAQSFGSLRIWLAGDAAHATGPVGGQSMNVGLREAYDLAECCSSALNRGASPDVFREYAKQRRDEWSRLLGLSGTLQATGTAQEWARSMASRILPCVPASGDELEQLLGQIGLTVA